MAFVEQLLFWMNVASLVLIIITVKFMVRNREYELLEVEKSYNSMLFSVFFMLLVTLSFIMIISPNVFSWLSNYIDANTYLPLVDSIARIALIPIFAVCVLVGMILGRDYLSDYPKKEEVKKGKKEEKKK